MTGNTRKGSSQEIHRKYTKNTLCQGVYEKGYHRKYTINTLCQGTHEKGYHRNTQKMHYAREHTKRVITGIHKKCIMPGNTRKGLSQEYTKNALCQGTHEKGYHRKYTYTKRHYAREHTKRHNPKEAYQNVLCQETYEKA